MLTGFVSADTLSLSLTQRIKLMTHQPDSATRTLHPEFPKEPILGAVGGAQPKLLLCRNDDGKYRSPQRSDEETLHRFEVADEVVGWLVEYFRRKKAEFPNWTDEKNFERIRLALVKKAQEGKWAFTVAEQAWIMSRLREQAL